MRILLVADIESEYIWDHFDAERFEGVDLIISCGDLKSEYLSYLATMIHVPVFYVHGNHDTGYIDNPPGGCDSIEDKLVEFNGFRILGLGGSKKYSYHDRYSVPPFQYTEKQMEKRIRKFRFQLYMKKGFDILVTHAPAFGISDGDDVCHTGFEAFLPLLEKYKPRYFFHGHMHLKFGRAPRFILYNNITVIDAAGYYILDIPE
jgi:Icc-related predicted phosphoesterase